MDDKGNERHFIIEKLLDSCLTFDYTSRPSSSELLTLIDKLIVDNIGQFQAALNSQKGS